MDNQEFILITCGINEEDRRLDRVIRNTFPSMPLSLIHKSIRTGSIRVTGSKKGLGYRIQTGDVITVPRSMVPSRRSSSIGGAQPLNKMAVIMENRHLLFVNKEAGMLVHGEDSLLLQVLAYLDYSPGEASSFTPGPLHRLDRNSSGIICFGKTAPGARYFSGLLRDGGIAKYYLGLVDGELKAKREWKDLLSRNRQTRKSYVSKDGTGKEALLSVEPILFKGGRTLLLARLFTGLTHQIRAQCSAHGYPLSGDRKYGGSFLENGYFLHAYSLQFERTGEFIDTRYIRAIPGHSAINKLRPVLGRMSFDDLFNRIDLLIKG